ncbi:MAG: protein-tyrosine-phosphatase [Candidatus Latescibacteria bacterium]|nr:protein-tyrosine-phosphatase [Candidatus Latescibacterota bacterium]
MEGLFDERGRLRLEGAANVRDLGGHARVGRGHTRPRCFLRADNMAYLTPADQQILLDYGVRTVVDLRRSNEVAETPNALAASTAVAFHHINLIGDHDLELGSVPIAAGPAEGIAHTYCGWLDHCQGQMRRVMEILAAPGALPALFHCHAGKDRTGVTAALLLSLAGVPDTTIAADYGLTAHYLIAGYLQLPLRDQSVSNWEDYQRLYCDPRAMQLVLDHLQRHYGGVEKYLQAIGLDEGGINRLRAAFTKE